MKEFLIEYDEKQVVLQEMFMAGSVLFCVQSENRMILTRAQKPNGEWFWTSMPQGRQKEAILFGRLIEQKLKGIASIFLFSSCTKNDIG